MSYPEETVKYDSDYGVVMLTGPRKAIEQIFDDISKCRDIGEYVQDVYVAKPETPEARRFATIIEHREPDHTWPK